MLPVALRRELIHRDLDLFQVDVVHGELPRPIQRPEMLLSRMLVRQFFFDEPSQRLLDQPIAFLRTFGIPKLDLTPYIGNDSYPLFRKSADRSLFATMRSEPLKFEVLSRVRLWVWTTAFGKVIEYEGESTI
jgi:hypothetical protein